MVLDVVYNHFGDTYNFIPHYAPEWFDPEIKTPWGPGVNFRQQAVRQFYYENACWWLTEYDFDGLRFDAVHEIGTEARDLFLGELARAARRGKPDAALIIENVRNQMHWLTRDADDRPVDFTAQWNDDYHHVINYLVTGEKKGGYEDEGRDAVADLEKSLADGFVHDGDAGGESDGRTRHEPASQLPMQTFIGYVQNHDQIGNRPDGSRIVDRVDAERLDFGHFVTLLSPQIPLFFMGEEAHLRSRFHFFFDLPEPKASEKRDDRYTQMQGVFNETVAPGSLPDPQDPQTFQSSKLDWGQYGRTEHVEALARFRELCALRRELIWPLSATRCLNAWSARQGQRAHRHLAIRGRHLQHAAQPHGRRRHDVGLAGRAGRLDRPLRVPPRAGQGLAMVGAGVAELDRQHARIFDLPQRKARLDRADSVELRQPFAKERLIGREVGADDTEQEVELPGHQVALPSPRASRRWRRQNGRAGRRAAARA